LGKERIFDFPIAQQLWNKKSGATNTGWLRWKGFGKNEILQAAVGEIRNELDEAEQQPE